MLRTILLLGLCVMLGIFALRLVFNVLGGVVGLLLWLLFLALQIAIVGLVVYVIIRVFSPDTARRIRDKFSGDRL
jgi:hypothetical protein